MDFKLLCSDLDGTLLTTKSDVSDFTIRQISKLKAKVKIVLVSARMPQSMTYVQERLGIANEPIICYNGALVLEGNTEILSKTIAFEVMEAVYQLATTLHIQLGLYHRREWYVEETSERVQKEIDYTRTLPVFRPTKETLIDWLNRHLSAHKIMLMGTKTTADTIFLELVERFGEQLHIYRSNDTLIELAPRSVSKLSAIQSLLDKNETMAQVLSFGDNFNDIAMLQHSGLGVAVGNAREQVKAIADDITLKNTEDGVAHYIEQHLI